MNNRVLIAAAVLVLGLGAWQIVTSDFVAGSGSIDPGEYRVLNVQTGHKSSVDIQDVTSWPIECPDTGEKTCYPAQLCPNTACISEGERTWVVLNSELGKVGATKCPVCKTAVTMRNTGFDDRPEGLADKEKDSKNKKRRGRRKRPRRSGG